MPEALPLADFSPITLGCMSLGHDSGDQWNSGRLVPDKESGIAWVRRAVELGINHFDTAQGYGNGLSEQWLGEALSVFPRESLLITTKVGKALPGQDHAFCRANIRAVCERALEHMQVDYLDHFMFHNLKFDDRVEEAVAAMQELQAEGKIRGCAACPIDPLAQVTTELWPQLHPSHWHTHGGPYWHAPQDPDLQLAVDRQEPVVIFAPYLYGLLTGRWGAADADVVLERFQNGNWRHPWFVAPKKHGLYTESHDVVKTLTAFDKVKEAFDVDALGFRALLLRYIRSLPGSPSICIGFSKLAHIEEAVEAVAPGPLSQADAQRFHELIQC